MSKLKHNYELVVITTTTKVKNNIATRVDKRRSSGKYASREELDAAIVKQQQKETPHFEALLYREGRKLTYKKQSKNYRLTDSVYTGTLPVAPTQEDPKSE